MGRRKSFVPRVACLEPRSLLTTIVALVDTGVNLTDVANNPSLYDMADAYNAYTQQSAAQFGYSVVQDNNGHGSTVAASIKSGIADTGISNPGVQILPINDSDSSPAGNLDFGAILRGIYYAADHGARVINLSIGGPGDEGLSQAIIYAESKGAVVVTAAGNKGFGKQQNGVNIDDPNNTLAIFPADTHSSNMLVAVSSTLTGQLYSDSNWGPIHADLGAPRDPTSFASGYTSGVAGVVAALRPDWNAGQVVARVKNTVTVEPGLQGKVTTNGEINPVAAVSNIQAIPRSERADDFTGAGHSDVAVYRPSTGLWYIAPNAGAGQSSNGVGPGAFTVAFGGSSLVPVPADYTGSGHADVADYSPSTGLWYIAPNAGPGQPAGGAGSGAYTVLYGGDPSFVPVPGDYTGSGHAEIALYLPSTGTWYVAPNAGPGQSSNGAGPGAFTVQLGGQAGDIPVPGDYDGKGYTEFAIYRPSTGQWFIAPNAGPGQPNGGAGNGVYTIAWSASAGQIPVPGDYTGGNHTEPAFYSPSTGTWAIAPDAGPGHFDYSGLDPDPTNVGPVTYTVTFGGDPSFVPVPGDYTGSGHTEIALYLPSTGTWYVAPNAGPEQSSNGAGPGAFTVVFGGSDMVPASNGVPNGAPTGGYAAAVRVFRPTSPNHSTTGGSSSQATGVALPLIPQSNVGDSLELLTPASSRKKNNFGRLTTST